MCRRVTNRSGGLDSDHVWRVRDPVEWGFVMSKLYFSNPSTNPRFNQDRFGSVEYNISINSYSSIFVYQTFRIDSV